MIRNKNRKKTKILLSHLFKVNYSFQAYHDFMMASGPTIKSSDGSIQIWDLAQQKELCSLKEHEFFFLNYLFFYF